MDNDEKEYIQALINRAQELTVEQKPESRVIQQEEVNPKKPRAKRNYTDEQKAKMVERLANARAKSLETRQLKASIKNGIKQETKELEKQRLQELSAKYAKKDNTTNQSEVPIQNNNPQSQHIQKATNAILNAHQNAQQNKTSQEQSTPKTTAQLPPVPPVKPMFFMPKMNHAMKHNHFKSPL